MATEAQREDWIRRWGEASWNEAQAVVKGIGKEICDNLNRNVLEEEQLARTEAQQRLASALCDSSSHMNLMPHAEQRPCSYHRQRAADALKALERAAAGRGRGPASR